MTKDTGGLAFPLVGDHMMIVETGMTLRDYFAAKAMQGELACQAQGSYEWNHPSKLAEYSYKIADSMMEARSK